MERARAAGGDSPEAINPGQWISILSLACSQVTSIQLDGSHCSRPGARGDGLIYDNDVPKKVLAGADDPGRQ